ncbi:hypothetical protein BH11PLA2_BH11PLA2_45600 [soil metagenome]
MQQFYWGQIMKITGIVVMIIGVVALLFFGVMSFQPESTPSPGSMRQVMPVPLVIGLAAIIGGALILRYAGRGYVVLPKSTPAS